MKDRRTTRLRSDLKIGDLVTRRKGWFVPLREPFPNAAIYGVWNGDEIKPYGQSKGSGVQAV